MKVQFEYVDKNWKNVMIVLDNVAVPHKKSSVKLPNTEHAYKVIEIVYEYDITKGIPYAKVLLSATH